MDQFTLPTGAVVKVKRSLSGPLIAYDRKLPTVLYDMLFPSVKGREAEHYVPKDRDYDKPPSLNLADYDLVSPAVLYAERKAQPGRPLLLDAVTAKEVFVSYWILAKYNQVELAKEYKLTRLSIHNLVHRRTVWFL